jgi:hypothetical protein
LRNDVVGILYLPAILCLASADTEFIGTRVNARLMLWIMRSRQVERLAEPAKARPPGSKPICVLVNPC